MIESLGTWLIENPYNVITGLFSGGGVLATLLWWYSRWNDRRRISVRFIRETYNPKRDAEVLLQFEVINLGEKSTALLPEVTVKALSPEHERCHFVLNIDEPDRTLPSHEPRRFNAKAIVGAVYLFSWYRKYQFTVTKGGRAVIRHRNASHEHLGSVRFWTESLLFRLFGWLPAQNE